MSFLDENTISNMLPEGVAKPAAIAIGALLLKYMMGGHGSAPAPQPPQQQASGGGLGRMLGGMLGGSQGTSAGMGGLGGLAGALAGAAAGGGLASGLGGLLDQFKNAGMGDAVNSWVSNGPNQSVQPEQVGQVIGSQTLSEIAAKAGVSEQELLQHLAQALPQVVDKLTPQGQLPGGFGRI